MADDSTTQYDLLIVGAGTGGYSAAFRAAQLGLKVGLVDQAKIGGTCLHWGCIPTKAMLESADLLSRIGKAKEFGIEVGEATVEYATIAKRRQQVVDRLHKGLQSLVKKNRVTFIQGRATLESGTRVRIVADDGSSDQVIEAKDVILATGSRVKSLPGLDPDGDRIVTSDDIVSNDRLPKSLIVVGGGAVGVEFASFFQAVGTEVTLLEYLPALTPLEDAEISKELERSLTRRGMKVMTNARFDPAAVTVDDDGVRLLVGPEGSEPKELRAEQLLVATGRAPNTDDVGLDRTAAVVERGIVKVDGQMRTAEPHLYAIGDIVGGLWLAHVAAHEGIAAVHAITGEEAEPIDYLTMPRATYCNPQIASIGRTQAECDRDGLPIKVGKFPFQALGKALIAGEHEGFVKVIAHQETDEVLGVHMIGAHVTDLISEASVSMLLEATAWEIGAAVHPHPTLSEALAEASLLVDGRAINF